MAGSSRRPSPSPIPSARQHRSPPPRAPAAASSSSSRRSFQSAEQAARAYDIANVHLHGSECGELNFPLEVPGTVPEVEPQGLRFVSACKRREDREARDPELIEKYRKALEAFAEAKHKADAAAGKQVKKEEEAGPLAAPAPATVKKEEDWEDVPLTPEPAVIELDSNSSSFEWDDED